MLSQLVPIEETTIRTTKRTPTETKTTFFQSAVPGSWVGFGGFFRLMDWFCPAFGLGLSVISYTSSVGSLKHRVSAAQDGTRIRPGVDRTGSMPDREGAVAIQLALV